MSAPSTRIIGDVLIVHPCIGSSPIPSPELLQSLCLFESLQLVTTAPQAALLRTLEERRTMTSGATLNHDFLGILEETRKDRQLWQLTPNLPKGTAGSGYTSHAGSVLSGLENEAKNFLRSLMCQALRNDPRNDPGKSMEKSRKSREKSPVSETVRLYMVDIFGS